VNRALLRVVVADDDLLVRMGIAAVLEQAGIEVAPQTDHAESCCGRSTRSSPDVAIVDIHIPPTLTRRDG
jgi:DNA-binding NarL/FixJ family response regulator